MVDRCDLTELPAAFCAHCLGHTGQQPAAAVRLAWWAWFPAAYPGRCNDCGDRIEVDDHIRADGEGGYLCEDCGENDD